MLYVIHTHKQHTLRHTIESHPQATPNTTHWPVPYPPSSLMMVTVATEVLPRDTPCWSPLYIKHTLKSSSNSTMLSSIATTMEHAVVELAGMFTVEVVARKSLNVATTAGSERRGA